MNSKHLLIMTILLGASNVAAIKGTAEFLARANPKALEIEGTGGVVDTQKVVVDSKNMISGVFAVDVRNFKTGSDKRDRHMAGYLESEKYPIATLKLEPILMAAGTKKTFKGVFTLHGVSKPVNGIVEFSSTKVAAKFSVDVTQYGIAVPTYELLTVGKDVDIKVDLEI